MGGTYSSDKTGKARTGNEVGLTPKAELFPEISSPIPRQPHRTAPSQEKKEGRSFGRGRGGVLDTD